MPFRRRTQGPLPPKLVRLMMRSVTNCVLFMQTNSHISPSIGRGKIVSLKLSLTAIPTSAGGQLADISHISGKHGPGRYGAPSSSPPVSLRSPDLSRSCLSYGAFTAFFDRLSIVAFALVSSWIVFFLLVWCLVANHPLLTKTFAHWSRTRANGLSMINAGAWILQSHVSFCNPDDLSC